MIDPTLLVEETRADMERYFKRYDLANFMEATESQLKELPACYLMTMTDDPTGTIYNGTEEQGSEEVVGLVIISTVSELRAARKHVLSVFRGHTPHPAETDIPFHPMAFVGGEIRTIKGNAYAWMDMYKTYTLGGC